MRKCTKACYKAREECCSCCCKTGQNCNNCCCCCCNFSTSCCNNVGTCLLRLLCCFVGSTSCDCWGKIISSYLTRLLYLTFPIVVVLASSILLAPDVKRGIEQYAKVLCVDFNQSVEATSNVVTANVTFSIDSFLDCDNFIGYLAVYRICMSVALFFFIMMCLMLFVYSSKDPRSKIHNGFWTIKWFAVIIVTGVLFFIPEGRNVAFSRTAMALGLLGSFFFIIIQVILLVDIAHRIANFFLDRLERSEDSKNVWWYLPMMFISISTYIGSLVGIVLLYIYFTEFESCHLNKFFITTTLTLGFTVSVIAILPCVQRVQVRSGVFQAAVVCGFCTYHTWSAISSEPYGPERDCHIHNSSTTKAVFAQSGNALAAFIVENVVLLITIAFICFYLSMKEHLKRFIGISKNADAGNRTEEDEELKCCNLKITRIDDENEKVTYSYSFFHLLMLISILYLMMHLTNWAEPGRIDSGHYRNTWVSVWIKMGTVWLCCGVYIWTLIAPRVLRNCRDFDNQGS